MSDSNRRPRDYESLYLSTCTCTLTCGERTIEVGSWASFAAYVPRSVDDMSAAKSGASEVGNGAERDDHPCVGSEAVTPQLSRSDRVISSCWQPGSEALGFSSLRKSSSRLLDRVLLPEYGWLDLLGHVTTEQNRYGTQNASRQAVGHRQEHPVRISTRRPRVATDQVAGTIVFPSPTRWPSFGSGSL